MNVCLNGIGHLKVDNERYVLDIDTTSSKIGGDQYVGISCAKCLKCRLSLFLIFPGVKSGGIPLQSVMINHRSEGKEDNSRTPARCRSFATISAVFFWLTKTMIGDGYTLLLRISSRRCL